MSILLPTIITSSSRTYLKSTCRACNPSRLITTHRSPIASSRCYSSLPTRPSVGVSIPVWRGYAKIHSSSRTRMAQAVTNASVPDGEPFLPLSTSASGQVGSTTMDNIKVIQPDISAMKQDEYWKDEEIYLIPEEQATLILTPEAIKQLSRIANRELSPTNSNKPEFLGLRLAVESGGCHGYQYKMDLTEERGVDDYLFVPGVEPVIPVVVDLISLGLLKGSKLHHATELIGSSFRLEDNPQAKEGGNCGCGVSWELKKDA